MKRYGNLESKWCNYDCLINAFKEVKKGKSFYYNLLQYESNLAVNLNNLLERLTNGTYTPKPSREFYIYEPKKRLIHAPELEDRIVHHALLSVVRDFIENRLIYHTFACRKDKGTHKASDIVKRWLYGYNNEGYYLKIDITKYFYNINHSLLCNELQKIIKCKRTLDVLNLFYKTNEGIGLPLGNVTSQIFANLALNKVDHFIKRELKHKHYFRYMDDILILSKDKEVLKQSLKKITEVIYSLNLKLNSKTKISALSDGIDFVGYKTWHNKRIIRKRTLFNIKRKLKRDANIQRISSFLSHAKRTASIVYVTKKIIELSENNSFIKLWIKNNRGDKYNAIFQT